MNFPFILLIRETFNWHFTMLKGELHMATATEAKGKRKKSFFNRFLDFIERYGNKLPDPVMLFV